MQTLKLTISYDGTHYVGWQRQKNGLSVQECLERALSKMTKEKVGVTGASRTDAGVHAVAQVVSFKCKKNIPPTAFLRGLIPLLPRDIVVTSVEEAPHGFNARKQAASKHYRYLLYQARVPSPLLLERAWFLWKPLNLTAMRKAAKVLVGHHDFACFMATGSSVKGTKRTIREIKIRFTQNDNVFLAVDVWGDGFLRHQVRNMVGTLVEVGEGKRKPDEMKAILHSRKRTQAGRCAPACGLYLMNVAYG
ncbi:MAG: tRNA pseudouridine(38-40) synthase TruA [Deltaproteobacteria bacterium]|nr:tRNA pseudouridine(38-40) synthase TruA [Deltaproteobacteria bacterium]